MKNSIVVGLFHTWADHFQDKLKEDGVDGLIDCYNELLTNIETQSCAHGKDGIRLFDDDYHNCCGISYEYYNDISIRKALQIIFDNKPLILSNKQKNIIRDNDLKLQKLINENPENNLDDIDYSKKNWWENVLPKGINK